MDVLKEEENRILYLSEEVNEKTMSDLCFTILKYNEFDNKEEKEKKNFVRKPIKLYINTCGGSVYDMWSLIGIIKESKTPIYTYCNGYAFSAGFMIFISGHKRFMYKHSRLMFHQTYNKFQGKYKDLVEEMEELDYMMKEFVDYVTSTTKLTNDELQKVIDHKTDWYIYADKALELGIADEII